MATKSKKKAKGKKESLIDKIRNLMNGSGVGVLVGGIAATLAGSHIADQLVAKAPAEADDAPDTPNGDDAAENSVQSNSLSHLVDDELPIASNVTDDMSFTDAFAAAREQVGPGGVFQWNGQLYGTYTRAEWNAMLQVERAEYGEHFSWDHIDALGSDVAIAFSGRRENRRPNNNHTPQDDNNNEHKNDDQHDADDDIQQAEVDDDSDELESEIITESHSVSEPDVEVVEVLDDNVPADTPAHVDFADAFPESYPDAQNPCEAPDSHELFPYDDPTGFDFADDGDYVNNANVDGFLS